MRHESRGVLALVCLSVVLLACANGCQRIREAKAAPAEMLPAPKVDDVARLVRTETERARSEGRVLLVVVGATWCQPCTELHALVGEGKLGGRLGNVRFLEFDLDRDGQALAAAGYSSEMVPFIVVPGPDGRSSPLSTQGVAKAQGVSEGLVPRIEALVTQAQASRTKR